MLVVLVSATVLAVVVVGHPNLVEMYSTQQLLQVMVVMVRVVLLTEPPFLVLAVVVVLDLKPAVVNG
jgi:hypothetical protein